MSREQRVKPSVLVLIVSALSFAAPAAAQTAPAKVSPTPVTEQSASPPRSNADPEHVRDLLTRGTEALSANRNEEARSLLAEAYRLRRSYDVAAALGQAEIELAHYRDAAEHLDFAIREFPPGESRKLLKQLQDAFAGAKSHVATLRVSVNQPGCEVTLDGALVGTSPLSNDLFVEPGVHALGARVGTGSAVERSLGTTAGKEYAVELTLNPKAAALPPSAAAPNDTVTLTPRREASEVSPKTIALVGGGAVTVALLGLGIAERLRAADADEEAASVRSRLQSNCPAHGGSALCQELVDDVDRRNQANRLAIYSFIGAGVAGAATLSVWFLWDDSSRRDGRGPAKTKTARAKPLPLMVTLAPRHASLSFATSF